MAMTGVSLAGSAFSSESVWPFLLRTTEFTNCRTFLAHDAPGARVLRVFGPSGSGKSFLARELLVQAASDGRDGLGVYLDVPPAGLEASALLAKLDDLLSDRRLASRDAPSFVSRKAVRSWLATKHGRSARRLTYVYLAVRDLVAQIPLFGPFIKALFPQSAPVRAATGDSSAPLRFLMKRSRSRPVWLVVDNTQFLPLAVREALAIGFAEAGPHLRLVLIERVRAARINWAPVVAQAEAMDIDLRDASLEEVAALVEEILPDAADYEQLAATIFRRSSGNLKSVWYQLRLITSRREDQEELPASYEDVIVTLPTLDQTVLRFIVFTVGGLTLASLVSLLQATDLQLRPDAVTDAITDLAALGLLVVNGDSSDRVRVEHELVAQVVSDITPEEEKLELRAQAVAALSAVLEAGVGPRDEAVLYDRLLGIVEGAELRRSPLLLSLVVGFIQDQVETERYGYLTGICRDSVCWDVLDELPETTVRSLLDAIQKSSLFDFGLVATTRLRRSASLHESLASLYEAKYLVQLFRYDEAATALERVAASRERQAVLFNITLNLAQDERAAEIAMAVYAEISDLTGTEQDYLILRNSAHLFGASDARALLEAAVAGFQALGRRFAAATAVNNLGIVDLTSGSLAEARAGFEEARRELVALASAEVYQPLVNLSALSLLGGDHRSAAQFLAAARDAAPVSLLQDKAMLDLNTIALEVCAGDVAGASVLERMRPAVAAARKTRDLRFLDVVTWFAEELAAALAGVAPPAGPVRRRITELRTNGRVPLEVFVPAQIAGTSLDVPFVLSPHWRY